MLHGSDLIRLMITLGISMLLHEVANRAIALAGSVDGLPGVEIGQLFGVFHFDLYRKTAYLYVLSISILLIEHDMSLVFRFADRITMLVGGAVLVTGTPAAIADDARVREVYLGKGHRNAHT